MIAILRNGFLALASNFRSQLLFVLVSILINAYGLIAVAAPLPSGKSQFEFTAWPGHEMTVWTFKPVTQGRPMPVVFVMHGVLRNAAEYRDNWSALAKKNRFLLIVPEFSNKAFPKAAGYVLGNIRTRSGSPVPVDQWAFTMIERIFDHVRRLESSTEENYQMYGHSAGAQFVHRYLYYVPNARASKIVIANAGWYTMPDFNVTFPYGLYDSGVGGNAVRSILKRRIVVLLGNQDVDPLHKYLRRTPEAMLQGPHRFARGHKFFETAASTAKILKVPFNWQLHAVKGAGHNDRKMSGAAVKWLLAGYQPGSPGWIAACARKYSSFEPHTGLYTTYGGDKRRCRLP